MLAAALLVAVVVTPLVAADDHLAYLNPQVQPTDLNLGDQVWTAATVDNPNNHTVNTTVLLYVNGLDVFGWTLSLPAFGQTQVGHWYQPPSAGTYYIHIGNREPVQVTVHGSSTVVPAPGAGFVVVLVAAVAVLFMRRIGGDP